MSPENEGGRKITNSVVPGPYEQQRRSSSKIAEVRNSIKKVVKKEEDRIIYFN
jgi:hypothetical protein